MIDSLSQNDNACFVCIDIKTKKINFRIENQTRTFIQEDHLDTTRRFIKQSLICRLNEEYIVLNILQLNRVECDSICISATYQKFNEHGNIGKAIKMKNLAINKSELLGVIISPPIKEIKKSEKRYYWFTGTLVIVI